MAAVRERCIDAFETLDDGTHPAKAQLVFTSGGVIAAICQHLLDLTDKATREMNWSLANTGVARELFTKGRRGLGCLNSTAHLTGPAGRICGPTGRSEANTAGVHRHHSSSTQRSTKDIACKTSYLISPGASRS